MRYTSGASRTRIFCLTFLLGLMLCFGSPPGPAPTATVAPADELGEVGKAVVSLKEGKSLHLDEIRAYLDGKLARYKIPKYYEIRDALPKSAAGKILKRKLEEEHK